jgi:predicted permease
MLARVIGAAETVWLDLRQAWRGYRKSPGFTATILLTLALAIGANSTIFSIVHAMLIQPLPYRDADRLAFIWLGLARGPLSGPDFRDIREGNSTFDDIGGIWASGSVALGGDGEDPEQLRGAMATTNFFRVLGVEAAFGRSFLPEDAVPDAPPRILLGWELFTRRFGGDPSIVGRQIFVNEEPVTVIGVMPRSFRLLLPLDSGVPDALQAFIPFWPEFEQGPRGNQFLRVVARMRPGVTVEQARADVDNIARRVAGELGTNRAFTTVALQADDTREFRGPLLSLYAGVGILLMIACVNVGGLLIARAASRRKEIALRLALGASRGRLLRQSLVEGLLLALLGAAAGLFAAYAGLRILLALVPESLGRLTASRLDATVFAYTAALSLAWGVLFSLAPLAEIFRTGRRSQQLLAQASGRLSALPVRYRTRRALLVVQIALSVILLTGAGLLVRAFSAVQNIDIGFRGDRHLTFRLALPGSRYENTEQVVAADAALRERLAAIPGATGVGAISHVPFDDLPNWGLTYAIDVAEKPAGGGTPRANTRAITPGLFEALGVRLLEGRFFREDEQGSLVVIVDDLLAKRLWPNQSAIGQQLRIGQAAPDARATVVGVISHLRLRAIVEDLTPQLFLPYRLWQRSPMAYVVRTDRDPSTLAADVRSTISAFDARLPIYDVHTLDRYVQNALAIRRFTMQLAAAFALTALLLTSVGVYGVLAYAVAARHHELGVRRALGAGAPQVLGEVFREGLGFALAGSVLGLVGAALAGQLLQNQLYGVHPRDPIAYGTSLALILLGALLACWIPGRRAVSVNPADALRAE